MEEKGSAVIFRIKIFKTPLVGKVSEITSQVTTMQYELSYDEETGPINDDD